MKKLAALLTIAFLTAALITWAAAEDDEEREDRGGDSGSVEPPTRREVVTETVYLPDPETEKKLADALAEVDRLKVELALTNTTLQYALDEGKALRGELDAANARISRLSSDVSVLRSYEERKPTLDTTAVMDIYGYANDTGNADTEAPASVSYPQPVERPFPFNILALFNLL